MSNKDAEMGGHIFPLAREMVKRACDASGRVTSTVVVYVDASTQYRVLVEVLYTLSQLGYDDVFVATRTVSPLDESKEPHGVHLRTRRSADVQLIVRETGMWLTDADGSAFGPDCRPLTQQPTVSSPTGSLRLVDAQGCIESLTDESGSVHLVLDGGMPLRTMMPLLHAFGAKRAVTPAFPYRFPRDVSQTPHTTSEPQSVPAEKGNASDVVNGLKNAFSDCYKRELRDSGDNTRTGTLTVTLRVNSVGSVSDVSVAASGNLTSTSECVRSLATSAQFTPPEGGSATIRFPVTFRPMDELFGQKLPCQKASNQ